MKINDKMKELKKSLLTGVHQAFSVNRNKVESKPIFDKDISMYILNRYIHDEIKHHLTEVNLIISKSKQYKI